MTGMAMSRQRAQALLEMAGRGAYEFALFWTDTYGVDIEGTDAEVRARCKEEGLGQLDIDDALGAAKIFREYSAARHIIRKRYVP